MITAVSGFPAWVLVRNPGALLSRPMAEETIRGRGVPPAGGGGRPPRQFAAFEQRVLALAENVFARLVKPSFWRNPINFLRDKMVKMGMGEGKLSDGLSKLVGVYNQITSGKVLRAKVAEFLGETRVERKEVEAIFGEDCSWRGFFVDPDAEKLQFFPAIVDAQHLFMQHIKDPGRAAKLLALYQQTRDVRHCLPWYVSVGFKLRPLFQFAVWQITRRFVIAPSLEKAVPKVQKLAAKGIYATMDLIGESAHTEAEATAKFNEYKAFLEKAAAGRIKIPNLSASLKLTALTTDLLNEKKREIVAVLVKASPEVKKALLDYVDGAALTVGAGEKFEERVTDALWGIFKKEPVRQLFGTVGERAALVELIKDALLNKDRTVFTENGRQLLDACLDMRPETTELAANLLLGENKMGELKERVRILLRLAIKAGARLTIDMEQYRYKEVTFKFFKEILQEQEFKRCDNLEIVVQTYLKDAKADAEKLMRWAADRWANYGVFTRIRLVKGAYVKSEAVEAQRMGLANPICDGQEATNTNFDEVARMLLDSYLFFRVAFASHNPTTIFKVLAYAMEKGIKKEDLEIQMLYGMASSPLLLALAKAGYKVAYYTPIGPIKKAIEYLARRMDENKNLKSCLGRLQDYFEEKISLTDLIFPQPVMAIA